MEYVISIQYCKSGSNGRSSIKSYRVLREGYYSAASFIEAYTDSLMEKGYIILSVSLESLKGFCIRIRS